MNKKYCVYIHKNKSNGKVYIGLTKHGDDPNKRWRNGSHYEESPHFYKAIQKYGWENFEHLILENQLTLEEAQEKEKFYIKQYDSTNQEKGYNMTGGGEGHLGVPRTSITKEKISLANSQPVRCLENNLVFHSERAASEYYNISRSHIGSVCNGSRFIAGGFHWEKVSDNELIISDEEAKMRIKAIEEKREIQGVKSVICLETNIIYDSIKEVSDIFNISPSCIVEACKGGQKKAANLHWEYYNEKENYNIENNLQKIANIENNRITPCKKVRCVETQIIYNSAIEASEKTGATRSGISNCCNGKAKTAKKLHWEFVE